MLEYSNCSQHGQAWDLDLGETIALEHMSTVHALRIRVHHDTSYPHQSRAKAEVWIKDQGWTEVASYQHHEWAADRVLAQGCAGTESMWHAAEELRARAIATLELA